MSWRQESLEEFVELITKGTTPTTYGYNFTSEGVNYIRAEGISKDGRIEDSTFLKISEECHEKLKRSQLKENDILFSIAGMALGKTGKVKTEYLPANTNQAVAIIRPKVKFIDPSFLQYQFINPIFYRKVNKISGQAAQPNINLTQLKSLEIQIPALPIQQKIASILSTYDDLIENNLKRIKLLEEAAQHLYKEWFVNFKFPGSENVLINEETGLPQEWEKKRADQVFKINIGKTPPRKEPQWFSQKNGIKWVSISDMNKSQIYALDTKERIVPEGVDKFNVKVVEKGTILLSFKLTIGSVAVATERMVSNEAIAHFNIDQSTPSTEYTYLYLKTFPYQTLGSTSSIGKALNSKLVKAIPFIQPSEGVLKQFKKTVDPIFSQILTLLEANQRLKESRDLLLPRLMNRTIEV